MKTKIFLALAVTAFLGLLFACSTDSGDKTFKVTYYLNDETAGVHATKTVASGKTVGALPEDPERETHNFTGWNTDKEGNGVEFTADTKIKKNTAVYAQWKLKGSLSTITFDKNHSDAAGTYAEADPQTKSVLSTVGPLPTPPTRESAWIFVKWTVNADGTGGDIAANTPVTKDITVYAQWAESVTVSFNLAGGSGTIDDIKIAKGGTLGGLYQTPTREGDFDFAGWWDETAATPVQYEAGTVINDNLTLTARWRVAYTVTFNSNFPEYADGTEAVPHTKTVIPPASAIDALPTPPAFAEGWDAGMDFTGWNTAADGSGTPFVANTPVSTSIPVYAQWTFTAGTTTVDGDTMVHNAPPMYTSDGATGQGTWEGTENGDGTATFSGGAVRYRFPDGYEDYDYVTLEYVFSGDMFVSLTRGETSTVYQPRGGGSGSQWVTLSDTGSYEFSLYQTGTNPGVAFLYNNDQGPKLGTIKWVSATFTKGPRYPVTFDYDGGDGDVETTYARSNPDMNIALPVPTKQDAIFYGWYNGTTRVTGLETLTAATTLKARWLSSDTPMERVEQMTNSGSGVPVYRFTLPGGTTWGQIKAITFKVRIDNSTSYGLTGSGRAHVVGSFLESNFNSSGAYIIGADWGPVRMKIIANNINVANILNAANGTDGENLLEKWVTFTQDITEGALDSGYNKALYPAADATGPFFLGAGVTSSGSAITIYMKDVALVKTDNTLIPRDDLETEMGTTTLGSLYWAGVTGTVIRRETLELPVFE